MRIQAQQIDADLSALHDGLGAVTKAAHAAAIAVPEISPVIALLVAALAGAVAGVTAFTAAIVSATNATNAMGEAARRSGGTAQEIAALTAMGLNPAAQAERAAALQERLSSDPMGQIAGAGMGIRALPRPHGATDEAANLLKALEMLRKVANADEQLQRARMLGLDDMLALVNVSEDVARAQSAMEHSLQGVANAETMRAANDLAAAGHLVSTAWTMVLQAFGKEAFSPIKDGLLALQNSLVSLAGVFKAHPEIGRFLGIGAQAVVIMISQIVEGLATVLNWIAELLANTKLGDMIRADLNRTQKEAAQATAKATQASQAAADQWARAMNQGMFGGGERARSAIGAAMQGEFMRANFNRAAFRFGAFGL